MQDQKDDQQPLLPSADSDNKRDDSVRLSVNEPSQPTTPAPQSRCNSFWGSIGTGCYNLGSGCYNTASWSAGKLWGATTWSLVKVAQLGQLLPYNIKPPRPSKILPNSMAGVERLALSTMMGAANFSSAFLVATNLLTPRPFSILLDSKNSLTLQPTVLAPQTRQYLYELNSDLNQTFIAQSYNAIVTSSLYGIYGFRNTFIYLSQQPVRVSDEKDEAKYNNSEMKTINVKQRHSPIVYLTALETLALVGGITTGITLYFNNKLNNPGLLNQDTVDPSIASSFDFENTVNERILLFTITTLSIKQLIDLIHRYHLNNHPNDLENRIARLEKNNDAEVKSDNEKKYDIKREENNNHYSPSYYKNNTACSIIAVLPKSIGLLPARIQPPKSAFLFRYDLNGYGAEVDRVLISLLSAAAWGTGAFALGSRFFTQTPAITPWYPPSREDIYIIFNPLDPINSTLAENIMNNAFCGIHNTFISQNNAIQAQDTSNFWLNTVLSSLTAIAAFRATFEMQSQSPVVVREQLKRETRSAEDSFDEKTPIIYQQPELKINSVLNKITPFDAIFILGGIVGGGLAAFYTNKPSDPSKIYSLQTIDIFLDVLKKQGQQTLLYIGTGLITTYMALRLGIHAVNKQNNIQRAQIKALEEKIAALMIQVNQQIPHDTAITVDNGIKAERQQTATTIDAKIATERQQNEKKHKHECEIELQEFKGKIQTEQSRFPGAQHLRRKELRDLLAKYDMPSSERKYDTNTDQNRDNKKDDNIDEKAADAKLTAFHTEIFEQPRALDHIPKTLEDALQAIKVLQDEMTALRRRKDIQQLQQQLNDLEQQLQPLLAQQQILRQQRQEQKYIFASITLRAFYLHLQVKLNQWFTAAMAVSGGDIEPSSMMNKALTLAGSALGVKTLGTGSAIAAAIGFVNTRKLRKERAEIIENYIISLSRSEEIAEQIARQLTLRYKMQITDLTAPSESESWFDRLTFTLTPNDGARTLAECAVLRMIEMLKAKETILDEFNEQNIDDCQKNLVVILIDSVFRSEQKHGKIPYLTTKSIDTIDPFKTDWTAEGIFSRPGIIVVEKNGKKQHYYSSNPESTHCNKPRKYGYFLGTQALVDEYKLVPSDNMIMQPDRDEVKATQSEDAKTQPVVNTHRASLSEDAKSLPAINRMSISISPGHETFVDETRRDIKNLQDRFGLLSKQVTTVLASGRFSATFSQISDTKAASASSSSVLSNIAEGNSSSASTSSTASGTDSSKSPSL